MRDRIVYEFCDVRVDLGLMAAVRAGEPIPLEPKAFDVLVYLLDHRDRLVTKDELLDRVWAGTFVTPNVLTRAVAQIRKGLGDESGDARYIETAAKRGYRFIAPVTVTGNGSASTSVAAPAFDSAPPPLPRRPAARLALIGAMVLAAFGLSAALLLDHRGSAAPSSDLHLQRLTNRRGFNTTPALAPDGRAFVYASDVNGPLELFLASLTPGVAEVQLTHDRGNNVQPSWSSDGQWIAFHSRSRGGVWILPSTGGAPQQVSDFGSDPAWAPDSTRIVFTSDAGGLAAQSSLWVVNRDGTGRKALTVVGTPPGGHRAPVWSHNGRFVAFIVSNGSWSMQIWTVNVETGQQHLIDTATNGADPSFSPSDTSILWGGMTATGNGRMFSRAIDANGEAVGSTETIFPMDEGIVENLTMSSTGTLLFTLKSIDANLWAVDVGADGRGGEPLRLTDDIARRTHPNYGPDGRILYQQVPVGSLPSIWTMNEDGSGATQLVAGVTGVCPEWDQRNNRVLFARTIPGQPDDLVWVDLASRRIAPFRPLNDMATVRLSADGKAIAYHTIDRDGRMSTWASAIDGEPKQVATDPEAVGYPTWSPDGKWLAVEIKRGDSTHVGVIPAGGGPVVVLTSERGQSWPYSWSPDGDRIAFAGQRDGVWNVFTVSRSTRAVTQLTSFTSAAGYVRYPAWAHARGRIVFERSFDTSNIWTATPLPTTTTARR